MSNHYGLGWAYGMEDKEPVLTVHKYESRIEDIITSDKRFLHMMEDMTDVDKADLFGKMLHVLNWVIEESEMMKDMIEEVLDDYYDDWYESGKEGYEE